MMLAQKNNHTLQESVINQIAREIHYFHYKSSQTRFTSVYMKMNAVQAKFHLTNKPMGIPQKQSYQQTVNDFNWFKDIIRHAKLTNNDARQWKGMRA